MLKKTTLVLVFTTVTLTIQAQKKKDLMDEVIQLKDSIVLLNDSIAKASRQVNTSNAKAELFEKENTELRDANATLLKNLSSFSQISKQNTETVNKALASLKNKEGQLKFITDDFSQNDSIAIAILTQAKQTLGEEAKVGVSDGDILFTHSLDFLFESDGETQVKEAAKAHLIKIGEIIVAHPNRTISVEGLNITGEFELTYQQTLAVANQLLAVEGIQPENVGIMAKDGNFKEGILIRLSSDSKSFYEKLKTEFK